MGRALIALLLGLPLGLGAELLALLSLLQAEGPLGLVDASALVGLHLFCAVCLAECLRLRRHADPARAHGAWRLGLVLGLLLPGFGPLLVAVLVARPPRTPRGASEDLLSPMEFRKRRAEAELAAEADKGHASVQVEAIGDALKDADKAKRLGAVEALRALENRQAVELLGQSLKNTVFEVRYHAVEALAGINKKYSTRIAKARAEAERSGTPESHRVLGEVYYEYASLEMEDPSIQQHLYRNAVASLRRAGALPPAAQVKLAASLEQLGEHEQALQAYRAALEAEPRTVEALVGIARLQYAQGQFDQLRATCRQILDLSPAGLEQQVVNAVALWAEGPEALGV